MPARSASERSLNGKKAAHTKWANTDSVQGTAAARLAFLAKFEAQVPQDVTDPAERARRAEHLRKAYFAGMALKSAQARRKAAS